MLIDQVFARSAAAATGAALAQVSYALEEGGWGAVADQEYRFRPLLAPSGYRWCPREEQQVLLLHTADGDLCAGVPAETRGLAPGEVELAGPDGAVIRLSRGGLVSITSPSGASLRFAADGSVVINGTTIPPLKEEP